MIERVIAALGSKSVGLELTNKEIADILWLAVQMQRKSAPSSLQVQSIQPTLPEKTPVIPSPSNKNTDSQKPSNPEEKSTNIYPQSPAINSDDSTESSGLPIKVPSPQALRNQLALARSLKPLKRRVPSRTAYVIDEGATAQRIAEEKLWIPVMRPAPERWLEVALVLDDSPSMMLWKQTIKEFRQLLERHGAFRDVRTWELSIIDTNEKVLLRPSGSAQKRFHSPKELIEPNGRRLFLVISDCVSPAWRSGATTKTLSVWANTSPMAILQVLPEWLWERSALGIAESVLLQSLAPGVPNQQLIAKALDLLDDVTNSLKIPMVSLEPESLQTWARMVAGAGDIQSKGFLFAANAPILDNTFAQPESSGASLSAKQRLQRFRLSASPMARKLAGLMAAAPVSLPVVRLIQQTMLPQSSQVHVAEVFLGGILKPLSDINVDIEPDNVQYEFFDGVRDLLLDSVPISLSAKVVHNISDYIAKWAGLSVDNFTAMLMLDNTASTPKALDNVSVRPFAIITAKVLRRLGGKYVQVAEKLEMYSVVPFQTNMSIVDYTRLRELLASERWREADIETFDLMRNIMRCQSGVWNRPEELQRFPCTDLLAINDLWVKYSNERFGFSVQEKIYSELVKISGNLNELTFFRNLGDRLGWRINSDWIDYTWASFKNAATGCLPMKWLGGGTLDGDELLGFSSLISRFQSCTPRENPSNLNDIIERILNGTHTDFDVEALRQWLNSGVSQNVQIGKYNVNIGQGQNVQIGDNTYHGLYAQAIREVARLVLKGNNAEDVRECVRSILKEEF